MSPLTSVPIVDMAPFSTGDPQARQAIATKIATACQNIGFFYVRNHGIPQPLIDHTFALSKQFFQQPFEVKQHLRDPDTPGRGYDCENQSLSARQFGR